MLLHQRREKLLHMKPSLSSSMMGSARYDSHVATAGKLARHVNGCDTPSYTWLPLVTTTPTDDLVEDTIDPLLEPDVAAVDHVAIAEAHPDTDTTLLCDYLLECDPEHAEPDEINASPVQTIWCTPVCCSARLYFKLS